MANLVGNADKGEVSPDLNSKDNNCLLTDSIVSGTSTGRLRFLRCTGLKDSDETIIRSPRLVPLGIRSGCYLRLATRIATGDSTVNGNGDKLDLVPDP